MLQNSVDSHRKVDAVAAGSVNSSPAGNRSAGNGALIINADDWGRNRETTDRILECLLCRTVSSASAMVFMTDSERAAALARERDISIGLHLNFTEPFASLHCPPRLKEHQRRLSRYLRSHRLAQAVYLPWLHGSFQYVVEAQLEEFGKLYGQKPQRIDGHHHMHLCANVLYADLLPKGAIVRRSFSFAAGEKSFLNRKYRKLVDTVLARRHHMADFFYSLSPIDASGRLASIFNLARDFAVEVETHPVRPSEHAFLTTEAIYHVANGIPVAPRYSLPRAGANHS